MQDLALAAIQLRRALFGPFAREPLTDAYRLFNGAGDGAPDLLVDAYAGFLVVNVVSPAALPLALPLEGALEEALKPRGMVRKLRAQEQGRGRAGTRPLESGRFERGRIAEETTRGERPPPALTVREESIPFEVELLGGFHCGLFTDMREERLRLRRLARGRSVLNLFAYTGAFSVAAALGGATMVTSVDVVEKALDRARRNFVLSGLDPSQHRFARMEVLDFLKMASRRGWSYGAIVLDPPTFAVFKSGRWSLKRDYPELLRSALAVLEPGGLLWAAANTESLSVVRFEQMLARAFKEAGREARVLTTGGLPPDYPTPVGLLEARYLKIRVLQAEGTGPGAGRC